MAWVTAEEIEAARNMSAIEYLKKYQPTRLKKSSARNEWELTDHDSFKINEVSGKWHWKSRDIGGISALNFLVKVDGIPFPEAVKMLCDECPSYVPPAVEEKERRPFVLPKKSTDCRRVIDYLNRRGVGNAEIRYCLQLGILYESLPYHNAVFVGVDEQQKPRYAFLRGIYDGGRAFKIEQAGSEKTYAFCVPPLGRSRRVAVYEACIDALAHMTLEHGTADKYRLVLGGISAPKEGSVYRDMKRPVALEQFLKRHPEVTEIEVCTDNDFAGRWACSHIENAYRDKYHVVANLPEPDGADYGDVARRAYENQKKICHKEWKAR